MNKESINKSDSCCGCGVCSLVCKKNAILFSKDDKGFIRYYIDSSKCINCNACTSVCPLEKKVSNISTESFYLFRSNDENIYKKSSSGGVFDGAARFIFEKGKAVCFGVDYDQDMHPRYSYAESYEKIDGFHGSKYVFANNKPENFGKVQSYLSEGYYVLFTGSPCYVSALMNYLKQHKANIERLYTIDFVCHGAGSPSFWEKHINMIERKTKKRVVGYQFRYKLSNVNSHSFHTKVTFSDNSTVIDKPYTKIYDNLFFKNTLMQDACYSCKYANKSRVSDLSMGDNKGYEYSKSDKVDFTNSSLALVNSKKGEEIMDYLLSIGYIKRISIDTLIQPHLNSPVEKPLYYNKFWKEYKTFGYFFVAMKYGAYNPISIYRLKKRGYLTSSLD